MSLTMRGRLRSGGALGLCLLLLVAGDAIAAEAPAAHHYTLNLPSQDLGAALRTLALMSQYRLLYKSELVANKTSPALQGEFTAAEAIDALLRGSGLAFQIVPPAVILIRKVEAAPLQPAPVAAADEAAVAAAASPAARRMPATGRADPDELLNEVIVTAARQNVSVTGAAAASATYGARQLEVRSIDNTETLNRQLPNVIVAAGNFFGREQGSFRMRGLPNVGIYVDGVAHRQTFGALMNIVELDRIEILRGPQGTLFGRNVVGGAIQYFTTRPQDTFSARIKVTAGSYQRFDVGANIDIPLRPTLLAKITAARLTHDGYLPSTTIDRRFGSQKDSVVRAMLQWQPTTDFSWLWIGSFEEQRSNGNPSTVWALNPVCPGDPEPPANFIGVAPNIACIYQHAGLPINQQYVYGARGERSTASDYNGPELYTMAQGVSTEARYRLSDASSLVGIGSYRGIRSTGYADFDGTPYHLFDGKNYNEPTESSGELRWQYSAGRLTGTTGLYLYRNESRFHRMNWVANDLRFEVNPRANALASAYLGYFFVAPVIDQLSYSTSRGWAAFGDWTFRPTEHWSLAAGVRYAVDAIGNAQYRPAQPIAVTCCVPILSVATDGGPALPQTVLRRTWTNMTPRLTAQYQWAPGVTSYVAYSEGYSQGGVNNVDGFAFAYDPEKLRNYELGLRAELPDKRLRLTASAFQGRYRDAQVATEVVPRFTSTVNAGDGSVRGLEVEGTVAVGRWLNINYGCGWLQSQYSSPPAATSIAPGARFPYAPASSHSLGMEYDRPVFGGAGLNIRADYGWQSNVDTGAGATKSAIPGYGLLNARLTYRSASGRWDAALSGTNLTDAYYRINGYYLPFDQFDNGTLGRPREWALTFRFRFG